MKKIILLIGLLLFTINNLYGIEPDGNKALKSSTKEEYELQESCGKRAEELFRKEYGSGLYEDKDDTTRYHYRNHYNRKLNKCFILVTQTSIPKDKETMEKLGFLTEKTLRDINENKPYGWFFKFENIEKPYKCEVLGKLRQITYCKSESEWDALVKPYMEE